MPTQDRSEVQLLTDYGLHFQAHSVSRSRGMRDIETQLRVDHSRNSVEP
jgi:hypothetical protein